MACQRQYIRLAGKLLERCPSQAQISYNQQFGENIWKAQSGLGRYDRRKSGGKLAGYTVGADVLPACMASGVCGVSGGKQRYG